MKLRTRITLETVADHIDHIRAVAGVAFSALYLARGFGITAWTHALYDIAVLLG